MRYKDLKTDEVKEMPISSDLVVYAHIPIEGVDTPVIGITQFVPFSGKVTAVIGKYLSNNYSNYPAINKLLIQEGILTPGCLAHGWVSTPYDEDSTYFEINSRTPDEEKVSESDYYLEKYIIDKVYQKKGSDWIQIWQVGDII